MSGIPLAGGSPTGLPTVNNPNLPPFPSIQQPLGPANSLISNNYNTIQTLPSSNLMPTNLVQNPLQVIQNEANQRRLVQLEDENAQRRNTTMTLQQMGTHLLQGQMDIQEQVLQYQFMLEQCMETLDHQNFILNGQAEELALLRAKMRNFQYFMDAFKHIKEGKQHPQSASGDSNFTDSNRFSLRNLLSLHTPSTSPFLAGGVTRVTSSKFQPFNSRYRSPNSRSSNINESRSMTPSIPNTTPANARLSRPISNLNK